MKKITLKQATELIKKINESKEFNAFFSKGKVEIESKIKIVDFK